MTISSLRITGFVVNILKSKNASPVTIHVPVSGMHVNTYTHNLH